MFKRRKRMKELEAIMIKASDSSKCWMEGSSDHRASLNYNGYYTAKIELGLLQSKPLFDWLTIAMWSCAIAFVICFWLALGLMI